MEFSEKYQTPEPESNSSQEGSDESRRKKRNSTEEIFSSDYIDNDFSFRYYGSPLRGNRTLLQDHFVSRDELYVG